jgi:putative intracellular protease/amidase
MIKKEVILVLISEFADWESAFVAAALNGGLADADPEGKIAPKYVVKTLSLTKDYAVSFGGLKVIPDYDIHSLPADYAALILIGGTFWRSSDANLIIPLVEDALKKDVLVAGICDASLFLGVNGFLNQVKHTSNTLKDLREYKKTKYSNEINYKAQQAVLDGNIVTANGTAFLEFTKEILLYLEAYTPSEIERFYSLYKRGYHNQ